jgi:hypothetical protein
MGVLAAAVFLPMAAHAQLYGVSLNGHEFDDPGPSSLYLIDPVTGAGTLIGDIGYAVNAIAVDPTTGIMYASTVQWNPPDWIGSLLQIDPATGAGTEIGTTDERFCCRALTFDSTGQLWGWTENTDDLVSIDKSTGVATVVGESGVGTAGQVLAMDPDDVLHLIQSSNHYIVDQVTGAANFQSNLGFDPGAGGAVIDPSGSLWASATTGLTQDSVIRITNIAGASFVDIDTDVEYLNALTLGDVDAGAARFKVTKTFSDGNDAEVDVMLSCNTGLPLEQEFTIAGGDPEGVTFVVTDIPDGGADCEVTETGTPAGYTTVLNGGDGCEWENVEGGLRVCSITNEADPATYTVLKDFTVYRDGGDAVIAEANVTITCDSEILNGGWEEDGSWYLTGTLEDGETLVASVDTTTGSATCSASEVINQSGVESSSAGCGPTALPAGGSHTCTFTNTVFFEGIPTLSQYGLAVLVLLTLGVGFVGLRRFV